MSQILEHGANKGFLAFAQCRPQLLGDGARHQAAQKLGLEHIGMGLVLHVLQQHQAQGHIADAVEPHQADCAGHGADAAAATCVVGAVDQAQ